MDDREYRADYGFRARLWSACNEGVLGMVSPLHVLPLMVLSLPVSVVPAERVAVEWIYLFVASMKIKTLSISGLHGREGIKRYTR